MLKGKFEAKIPVFHFLKIKTMEIRNNRFCVEREIFHELKILRFGRLGRCLHIPLKVQNGCKKTSEKTPSSKLRPEFHVFP